MTGAPPDIPKYFYWSDRRITRIATDGGINLQRSGSTKVKSPTVPLLPAVEFDRPRAPLSRPETADIIERYLSGATVRDFVTPPHVRFAAGSGPLTFAEFVNHGKVENIVSIFTQSVASDGTRVAIGMFGSRENLADIIASAPTNATGWSSSAAGEIFKFITSFGQNAYRIHDDTYIAREAVNLLAHQGGGLEKGTKRGFTYGHLGDHGEWLLEAYLDIEFNDDPVMAEHQQFDRVVVGAPLWIRTPKPHELVLYHDLDDSAMAPPPEKRRRLPRWRSTSG